MPADLATFQRAWELPPSLATSGKLAMFAAVLLGLACLVGGPPAPPHAAPLPRTLYEAAAAGDLPALEQFLRTMAVSAPDADGRRALHFAAQHGRTDAVRFLLAKGAKPWESDENGITPRHLAVNREIAEAVCVRNMGAPRSKLGWTPLHTAANGEVARFELAKERSQLETADTRHRTPLDRAVERENVELVRFLLDAGADFRTTKNKRTLPLKLAAGRGNLEIVNMLLEAGAHVNEYAIVNGALDVGEATVISPPMGLGETALGFAARSGRVDVVRRLLEAGARAETSDGWSQPVLRQAVEGGNVECVRFLIAAGAPVDPRPVFEGMSPLHVVVQAGRADLVRILLEAGAGVESFDSLGKRPIHSAVLLENPEITGLLLNAGAEYRSLRGEEDALWWAARHGYDSSVRLLLKAGADPAGVKGLRPIYGGAYRNTLDIVRTLLKAGADPNDALGVAVEFNFTPMAVELLAAGASPHGPPKLERGYLRQAVERGNYVIVKALLDAGAKPEPDSKSRSLLFTAVKKGDETTAMLLLAAGADPNYRPGEEGDIPLFEAALQGRTELVRALLKSGAALEYDAEIGPYHPIHVAGNPEIFQMLVDAGAKFSWSGHTPMYAARTPAMVDYFVKMGLDVNHCSPDRTTPLHQASSQGRADVVRRMLEHGANAGAPDYHGRKPVDVARDPAVRRVFEEFSARASR